jgi:hypothetical protein
MSALVRGLALVAILVVPATGSANGFFFWPARASYSSYYYYPAYYYAPSYAVTYQVPVYAAPVCPTPMEPAPAPRNFAQPRPAGPSAGPKTSEPPRAAGVTESRSYYSAYAVAPRAGERPTPDRCRVGFWNLTDHDVTLTIHNKTYPLVRGRSLKVEDLPRQFAWRVDSRETQNEKVPDSEGAVEIVIRR